MPKVTSTIREFDAIVIGGGLAGIVTASRLGVAGMKVALVDQSLPAAAGKLGGFAKFSGAKFSRLPAGQGLIPAAGSVEALEDVIEQLLAFFGLTSCEVEVPQEDDRDQLSASGLELRAYESIVLTPFEIDTMLARTTEFLAKKVTLIYEDVGSLVRHGEATHVVAQAGGVIAIAPIIVYAGGRLGGLLLERAGAIPQEGRGLDVGVRIEFPDKAALHKLRSLGPDAKILGGRCRTFCLNSPGSVYRYAFGDFSIPGGVVASDEVSAANVGMLCRIGPKLESLKQIAERLQSLTSKSYETNILGSGPPFHDKLLMMRDVYGEGVTNELVEFGLLTDRAGIIEWRSSHLIHFPLLDWHWSTFATGPNHRTTLPGIYVAGDSAGHARGLLQAGISGWLAAAEITG